MASLARFVFLFFLCLQAHAEEPVFHCQVQDLFSRQFTPLYFTNRDIAAATPQAVKISLDELTVRITLSVDTVFQDGVRFMRLLIEDIDPQGKRVGGSEFGFNEYYAINWEMRFTAKDERYRAHCSYIY